MFLLKIEQLVRVVSIYLYRLIKANETKKERTDKTINQGRLSECDPDASVALRLSKTSWVICLINSFTFHLVCFDRENYWIWPYVPTRKVQGFED